MANTQSPDKETLLRAFEAARAWSSLIVTLSTGGIVFTAIFRRDFAPKDQPVEAPFLLIAAWVSLGIAAVLGIWFLGALTATLNRGQVAELDVYDTMSRILAIFQMVAFLVGLSFVLAFAVINLIR